MTAPAIDARQIAARVEAFVRERGGLGSGRDLPLAAARTEATALREILAARGDPKVERAKLKAVPTFGVFADAYVEAMTPSWRNPKHAAQSKMTLTTYAGAIRDRPINEIETDDVLNVLQPWWKRTPASGCAVASRTC